MRPAAADRVLDVGCGLGKQLLPLSARVAHIVGVDVSPDLIAAVRDELPPEAAAELVVSDMDALGSAPVDGAFDLIYSVYALYYSQDVPALVDRLAGLLAQPDGRLFVMAPDVRATTRPGSPTSASCSRCPRRSVRMPPLVSRRTILPAVLDAFDDVRCVRFRNDVRFASLDDLMTYYRGCGSYCDPAREDDARAFFAERFERDGDYVIQKRAMAILAAHPGRPT